MKAVVYDRYGSPDVLRVDDVPMPAPAKGQVRVRIAATSINLSDWECLRGSPMYARLGGLRAPARRTLGSDIAGWVDAVGAGVTRFQTGDAVYGDNLALKGGFAEYAVAAESDLTNKPAELTFAEASTIPQAGAIVLARHRARGDRQPRPHQRRGRRLRHVRNPARETTRCPRDRRRQREQARLHAVSRRRRSRRLPRRGLHASRAARYDLILDLVAHRSVFAYRRALDRDGRYRCVGGSVRALLRVVTIGSLAGRLTRRSLGVLAVKLGPAHFERVAELCVAGDIAIRIDRTFPLEDVPAALAYVGDGHALGKVVVAQN